MDATPTGFDVKAALELTDGDAELLRELAGVFAADTPGQMDLIRAAAASRDATALRKAAHSLKGSLRVLGVASAAALAEEIETRGAAGTLDDVDPLVTALAAELDGLLGAIAVWLGEQPPGSPAA
jgi:HPt (histidine-containing phosphotransfer) domain-containing protein